MTIDRAAVERLEQRAAELMGLEPQISTSAQLKQWDKEAVIMFYQFVPICRSWLELDAENADLKQRNKDCARRILEQQRTTHAEIDDLANGIREAENRSVRYQDAVAEQAEELTLLRGVRDGMITGACEEQQRTIAELREALMDVIVHLPMKDCSVYCCCAKCCAKAVYERTGK